MSITSTTTSDPSTADGTAHTAHRRRTRGRGPIRSLLVLVGAVFVLALSAAPALADDPTTGPTAPAATQTVTVAPTATPLPQVGANGGGGTNTGNGNIGGGGLPAGLEIKPTSAPGQSKINWIAGVALGLAIVVSAVGLIFGFAKLSHAKSGGHVGSEHGMSIAYSAISLCGLSMIGAIIAGIWAA